MADNIFEERRKSLEESFFAKRNHELLQRLKKEAQEQDRREQLTTASGIHDQQVLEQLVKLDIHPETLAALSLVPLVVVAWADGSISEKERSAVLEAAASSGLNKTDDSYALLERWLQEKPGPELITTWKQYVGALSQSTDESTRRSLREDIMGRARHVAAAAGGILGLGKVSEAEQRVLDDLDRTFLSA